MLLVYKPSSKRASDELSPNGFQPSHVMEGNGSVGGVELTLSNENVKSVMAG